MMMLGYKEAKSNAIMGRLSSIPFSGGRRMLWEISPFLAYTPWETCPFTSLHAYPSFVSPSFFPFPFLPFSFTFTFPFSFLSLFPLFPHFLLKKY
jgi:hypothetical protein